MQHWSFLVPEFVRSNEDIHNLPLLCRGRMILHLNNSIQFGENGMILSHTGIVARPESLSTLSHNDRPRRDLLTRSNFDSETSARRITTIATGPTLLLGSHRSYQADGRRGVGGYGGQQSESSGEQ